MPATLADTGAGRRGWLAFVVIAAAFLLQAILRAGTPLNHDAAWYVHVARQLLGGQKLYSQIIEVNPPLGMWLMLPVVWISNATGLSAFNAFFAILLLLTAASLAAVNRYLRVVKGVAPAVRVVFMVLAAIALLYLPGADFGEREHLVALGFLPWVFLRLAKTDGAVVKPWEAALVGLCAALAVSIKPQAVLAPLLVEALLMQQSRQWRNVLSVENIAAALTVSAYMFLVYLWTPEFFTEMLPLGRAAYLPFYGFPLSAQVMNARWFLLLAAVAVMLLLWLRDAGSHRLTLVLLAASLGFGLSYFAQGKGFLYQVLPATLLAGLAASLQIAAAARSKPVAAIASALLACAPLLLEPAIYVAANVPFRDAIRTYKPDARSIFVASTRVSDGFPCVETENLNWASSLPTQWLAPYVQSRWQGSELQRDVFVDLALATTVRDFKSYQPDIVFIDESTTQNYVPGGTFDYVRFWSMDPGFAALWQGYERRGSAGRFAVFTKK